MKYIYKIECLVNHKVYIGQTNNFKRRKYEHLNRLRKGKDDNKYLQSDFNKFGENNFQTFILEEVSDQNYLERETYWMNYYGGIESNAIYNERDIYAYNKQYSENLSKALKGSKNGMYGKHHTKESIEAMKQKVSQKLKGRIVSEETRLKMSKTKTGTRKYSKEFVKQLQEEYNQVNSYTIIYSKYPEINKTTLYRLIRFGTPMYPQYYK